MAKLKHCPFCGGQARVCGFHYSVLGVAGDPKDFCVICFDCSASSYHYASTPEKIQALNMIKIKRLHFAWDDMKQSDAVLNGLELYREYGKIKDNRRLIVYVLTNYNTTHEEDLHRIYTLRDMGFDHDVRIYNKIIFKSVDKFEDYDWRKG